MLNNTTFCIEILRTFEGKELENFKDFISCRYFNTDKYVVRLLEILDRKKILSKMKPRDFDTNMRDIARKELFKDRLLAKAHELEKVKKEKTLFNAKMNLLQKLAENFLAIQTMKNDEVHKYELLYPQLLKKELFELFKRHANKSKKLLRKQDIKDQKYYGQLYRIERKFYDFLAINDRLDKEDNLSDMMRNLNIYYILNNLHITLSALALQENFDTKEYNFLPMNKIGTLIKYSEYSKNPSIKLYMAAIELQKSKSQKSYNDLKNMLDKKDSILFPAEILKDCYTTCLTYHSHKIRSADTDYYKNMFELYKTMHEKNLMLDENIMSPYQLKNMVIVACKQEQFEWAEDITEYYYPYVLNRIKESVYNFNIGIIAFYQKKYEFAHDKFIQVRDINLTYDINVRVLILKCYYEKARLRSRYKRHYNEKIMSNMRSTRSYFNHKKELSERIREGYVNFTQILIYLYRILHKEGRKTIEQIEEELKEKEANADKQWLLEKITELKNQK